MEQKLSRYQNLLVVLITLLLHAGIILSIIIIKFDHPQTEAMVLLSQEEEPEPYHTPQKDWVTMAPDSAYPGLPADAKALADRQARQATQASPTAMPGTAPDKHLSTNADEPTHEQQPKEEKTTPTLNDEQIQNAVSLAQKLLARAENRDAPKKEIEPVKEPREQPIAQTPPQSPTLTLAQLTQGFMQHLQESPMTVRSNNNGQASMEQLQQMHYMQKVIACIVNSYKINNNSSMRGYSMQQARVQLALNRDGSIHTLQLVQSSGNLTVDQFLLTMFQDAGSSFPPLPSSFKENTFHVPVFNVDRLESFGSTNGWYINNTMP